jgi:hypothetical protein
MKVEQHHSDPHWHDDLEQMLRETTEDQPFLVPGWVSWRANDFIQKAANELGWDKLLFWSDHGLRHGAAVDAARDAVPEDGQTQKDAEDLAVFRRTAQLAENMRRFYAEDPKFRHLRALEVKLISNTPQQIDELTRRVEDIRTRAKKELQLRDDADMDEFEISFEDEAALADCEPGEFLQLLAEKIKRWKTIRRNRNEDDTSSGEDEGDNDGDDDAPKQKKTKAKAKATTKAKAKAKTTAKAKKKPIAKKTAKAKKATPAKKTQERKKTAKTAGAKNKGARK